MKYLIFALAATSLTLLGININHIQEIKEHPEPKVIIQSTGVEKCPAISYTTQVELDNTYIHCHDCSIGAFLPHDDGITKCTHCGKKLEN